MILLLRTVYSPGEDVGLRNGEHVVADLKVGHYTGKRKADPSATKSAASG
jgi:hypothetical protein